MFLLGHRQLQALECRAEFWSLGILSCLISRLNLHAHTKPDHSIQLWSDNHSVQLLFISLLLFLSHCFPLKRTDQRYYLYGNYNIFQVSYFNLENYGNLNK